MKQRDQFFRQRSNHEDIWQVGCRHAGKKKSVQFLIALAQVFFEQVYHSIYASEFVGHKVIEQRGFFLSHNLQNFKRTWEALFSEAFCSSTLQCHPLFLRGHRRDTTYSTYCPSTAATTVAEVEEISKRPGPVTCHGHVMGKGRFLWLHDVT